MTIKITDITRRDIADAILLEKINLHGRLKETEFLSRIWDLDSLPSHDERYANASGDIWQHTVNNNDWDSDWIFSDPRFNLKGDDEIFLRFLCESIHPAVRADVTESERLCQLYNNYLKNDRYHIIEKTKISNKPVFIGCLMGALVSPGIDSAKETLSGTDAGYVAQQITRMEVAANQDPELAIGTAKELIETCCKSILNERNMPFSKTVMFAVGCFSFKAKAQLSPTKPLPITAKSMFLSQEVCSQ